MENQSNICNYYLNQSLFKYIFILKLVLNMCRLAIYNLYAFPFLSYVLVLILCLACN